MDSSNTRESALRQALVGLGVATAGQLQAALGRSQPTVSRLLNAQGPDLLVMGQGRSTRYALAEPFSGMPPACRCTGCTPTVVSRRGAAWQWPPASASTWKHQAWTC